MAAPRQGLPVRLERAPHRGAAFALSNASKALGNGSHVLRAVIVDLQLLGAGTRNLSETNGSQVDRHRAVPEDIGRRPADPIRSQRPKSHSWFHGGSTATGWPLPNDQVPPN